MNRDDIIYLSLLFFSMVFGLYYRKIKDATTKRIVGASLGLIIVFIVSGFHALHVLLSTFVNACIILYTDIRKCHIYTFAFSFLYLFFFRTTAYFGIPYPPSHTNLVQMMVTLKIIGLAFELNTSYELKKRKDEAKKSEEELLEDETCTVDLKFMDVFYYVFNYCGVLTGPYFRYRTYQDHINKTYHYYDDFTTALRGIALWVPFLGAVHVLTSYFFPLSYVNTEEFLNRSFFYRYWYIWPTFLIFRSRIYLGLILTEMVCILGGLGVYPAFSEPKSGHGPTTNFKKLKETSSPEELKKLDYNYETIHCLNPYEADCVPTMREAMKHWNITVQYWLATYIYKRFPYKKYRTGVTLLTSAVWHGVYAGYYFCIGTVPLALMYEDIWAKLLLGKETVTISNCYIPIKNDNSQNLVGNCYPTSYDYFKCFIEDIWHTHSQKWIVFKKSKISRLIMLFLKMQMFSYQTIAFVLLEIGKIINYYNCVYHCVPILYVGLYFLGKHLLKQKKIHEQRE